jgi:hypothetical protein
MPISKPSSLPRWASDPSAVVTEPSATDKDTGYVPGTPALAAHTNWLLNNLYQWMLYLNDPQSIAAEALQAQTLTVAQLATFSSNVVVDGTLTVGGFEVLTTASPTGVPTSRMVSTTSPLTGGGDLSADRTLGISDFVGSGPSNARGAVPAPGTPAGTAKFLCENATWAVPQGQLLRAPQVLTSGAGATYTPPTNCRAIYVQMVGGGGGGGGAADAFNMSAFGGGGAGGAYAAKYFLTAGATFTYTIGQGGSGGANSGGQGAVGTQTDFSNGSTTVSAKPGSGGQGQTAGTSLIAAAGGNGQVSTGGDVNGMGAPGTHGIRFSGSAGCSGNGGSSAFGGGGVGRVGGGSGNHGFGYGGGGGGGGATALSVVGGAGSDGVIIVWEYS